MDFLTEHNLLGLVIGIATFLIIGLFHPVVIKAEYYWGTRCWWIFLLLGLGGVAGSLATDNVLVGALAGVFAFSSFWTIKELFEQQERVRKGWFPANPKRQKQNSGNASKNQASSPKERTSPADVWRSCPSGEERAGASTDQKRQRRKSFEKSTTRTGRGSSRLSKEQYATRQKKLSRNVTGKNISEDITSRETSRNGLKAARGILRTTPTGSTKQTEEKAATTYGDQFL